MYGADFIPNGKEKARRFVAGLDNWIKSRMVGVQWVKFPEAADVANEIEQTGESRSKSEK